jgi:dUTPase
MAYAAAMRLKIRRLDSTISLPTYATEEAAGFDLAASQD